MSYRCEVCRDAVPHRQGRLIHVVMRAVPSGRREPPTYGEALRGRRGGKEPIPRVSATVRKEVAAEIAVCHACKLMLDGGTSLSALVRQHAG